MTKEEIISLGNKGTWPPGAWDELRKALRTLPDDYGQPQPFADGAYRLIYKSTLSGTYFIASDMFPTAEAARAGAVRDSLTLVRIVFIPHKLIE